MVHSLTRDDVIVALHEWAARRGWEMDGVGGVAVSYEKDRDGALLVAPQMEYEEMPAGGTTTEEQSVVPRLVFVRNRLDVACSSKAFADDPAALQIVRDAVKSIDGLVKELPADYAADQTTVDSFTFALFESINLQRANRWHNGDMEEWNIERWLMALAGEAGEACNAGKKLCRLLDGITAAGEMPADVAAAEDAIMFELADTVIYAACAAGRLRRSLAAAIVEKFNSVSKLNNFPERLPAPGVPASRPHVVTDGAMTSTIVPLILNTQPANNEERQLIALVKSFAEQLARKLIFKERERHHAGGWRTASVDALQSALIEHVGKGDPIDVGAFAAFLHYRGERAIMPTLALTDEQQATLLLAGEAAGAAYFLLHNIRQAAAAKTQAQTDIVVERVRSAIAVLEAVMKQAAMILPDEWIGRAFHVPPLDSESIAGASAAVTAAAMTPEKSRWDGKTWRFLAGQRVTIDGRGWIVVESSPQSIVIAGDGETEPKPLQRDTLHGIIFNGEDVGTMKVCDSYAHTPFMYRLRPSDWTPADGH